MTDKSLINFSLSLGIVAISSTPVFAQLHSERYPAATEMQILRDQFRELIRSNPINERNTQNQTQAGESLVIASSKIDTAVEPFVSSKRQNQTTQQANRRIQSLPDGDYFYGTSRVPNKSGSDYLIFRKKGNKVTGMRYPVPGETSCFTGTARVGAITNVTSEFVELGEGGKRQFIRERNINLTSYYKLRWNQAPNGGTKLIRECTKVFPI